MKTKQIRKMKDQHFVQNNTPWSLPPFICVGVCGGVSIIHSEHFFVLLLEFLTFTLNVHHVVVVVVLVLEYNRIIIPLDFHAISCASRTKRWIWTIHMHQNLRRLQKLDLLMFWNEQFRRLRPMRRVFPSITVSHKNLSGVWLFTCVLTDKTHVYTPCHRYHKSCFQQHHSPFRSLHGASFLCPRHPR